MLKDLFTAFILLPALFAFAGGMLYLYWNYPVSLLFPAGVYAFCWFNERKYARLDAMKKA